MRKEYNGIVGKYGIPRFQLCMVLLFRRNTMNYSRRTPMMQCSKKQKLAVVVPFSTDQSMFCDLQELLQISRSYINRSFIIDHISRSFSDK